MIKSSSQVALANGSQQISWKCDSNPTEVVFSWDGGQLSTGVAFDPINGVYTATALIPSEVFWAKLNTEDKVMRYEGEWGEGGTGGEIALLEVASGGDILKVPYCDLSTVDLRFYTQTMVPLEAVSSWNTTKKSWEIYDIDIESAYGANTLIARLSIRPYTTLVKEPDGANWVTLSDLPGGFIVEVVNHRRVTTDRIVNATICRDSLYGKTYQRSITP